MNTAQVSTRALTLNNVDFAKEALSDALGISRERNQEIIDIMRTFLRPETNIAEGLLKITETFPDPHEVTLAIFAYGHGLGINNDDDTPGHDGFGGGNNPFAAMLAQMLAEGNFAPERKNDEVE